MKKRFVGPLHSKSSPPLYLAMRQVRIVFGKMKLTFFPLCTLGSWIGAIGTVMGVPTSRAVGGMGKRFVGGKRTKKTTYSSQLTSSLSVDGVWPEVIYCRHVKMEIINRIYVKKRVIAL